MTREQRKAMRDAAEVLEEQAREAGRRVVGAEDDPDCDERTVAVLRREADKWRVPAEALRAALSAPPAAESEERGAREALERLVFAVGRVAHTHRWADSWGRWGSSLSPDERALGAVVRDAEIVLAAAAAAPPPAPPGQTKAPACCWDCDLETTTTVDAEGIKALPPGWNWIDVGEPFGRVMTCGCDPLTATVLSLPGGEAGSENGRGG